MNSACSFCTSLLPRARDRFPLKWVLKRRRVELLSREEATMSCISLNPRAATLAAAGCVVLLLATHSPAATVYTQTNLVSDGFVPAAHTEPLLKNPWGISIDPTAGRSGCPTRGRTPARSTR